MKLLFVCNQGRNRSKQARELVESEATKRGWEVETQSVGIHSDVMPLTQALMDWGDIIFLFQEDHQVLLQERYPRAMFRMRCVLIPVDDIYDYGSPVLKKKLRSKLRGWWEFLEECVGA